MQGVRKRCRALVKRVNAFVGSIIEEHKQGRTIGAVVDGAGSFVDVLLGLQKEEKLSDADMVAVLWVRPSIFVQFMTKSPRFVLLFHSGAVYLVVSVC